MCTKAGYLILPSPLGSSYYRPRITRLEARAPSCVVLAVISAHGTKQELAVGNKQDEGKTVGSASESSPPTPHRAPHETETDFSQDPFVQVPIAVMMGGPPPTRWIVSRKLIDTAMLIRAWPVIHGTACSYRLSRTPLFMLLIQASLHQPIYQIAQQSVCSRDPFLGAEYVEALLGWAQVCVTTVPFTPPHASQFADILPIAVYVRLREHIACNALCLINYPA